MPITKCATLISKESEGLVSPEEAEKLVKELHDRSMRKKSAGSPEDIATVMMREAKEMAEELKVEAMIAKRNAVINRARYMAASKIVVESKNKFLALKSILAGTAEARNMAGNSIDARQKMYAYKYKAGLVMDLEQKGLMPLFNSEDYSRMIARELAELNTPDGGAPGVTKNAKALEMAQIVHKWQTRAIERQNANGAWIRKLPGYVTRTSHDMVAIRKAGYLKWKEFILPKLDAQTFKYVEAGKEEEFLKSAWEALASGLHFKHGEGNFDINQAFKVSGSVAKKISQERLLHFKTPDDWFEYNQEFGSKSFREAIMSGFDHAAQSTAMMEGLGTNPHAVLDRLKQDALKALRSSANTGDKNAAKQIDKIQGRDIDNLMATIDGTTRRPANVTAAKIGAGIRSVQSLAKLGGSTISSLSDIATLATELQYNGMTFLDSYSGLTQALFKGRSAAEKEEIGSLVLAGMEGALGEIHGRWHSEDGLPGKMSKAMYLYFKLNGQNWWNDVLKTYTTSALSANIANNADRAFADISSDLARNLDRYGIGEKDWPVIQKMIHKSETGTRYALPEKVFEIDNEEIKALLGDKKMSDYAAKEYKNTLQRNLDTYFVDRSDTAIPTPGANEKALLLRGTQPGDALGEALRFWGQFKSFPITFISKIYNRETVGRVAGGSMRSGFGGFVDGMRHGKGAIGGMVQTIIGTTAMGYVAMSIKDILKGLTPRPANDPKTWAAAMVQGGGAGIYGDYLFGEFNRFGRDALSSLAGPTFGQINDVMEIYSRFKTGDDVGANIVRLMKNNTPFVNLFYTRAALDYLVLYQLQENMNPGFLKRMEQRVRRENDQEFLFPPSERIQ